jgi:hypothetical protein
MFFKVGVGLNLGRGFTFTKTVSNRVQPPKVREITYRALVINVLEFVKTSEIVSEGVKGTIAVGVMPLVSIRFQPKTTPEVADVAL